jgi:hypothetical protein
MVALEEKGTFTRTVRIPGLVLGEERRVPVH